ncbi:MAG: hypothetical protein FIB07_18040 [Candidatus Methanoperedens sp.]|nr:hypothetical protein [Candidatus Methanoperedens sp.]
MDRMNRKYVTLGLLLILAIALVGLPEALAVSNYLDAFKTKYGTANTKLDTCDICHVYGSNARNLYGQDVEIQLIGGATTTLTAGATTTLTIDQALTNVEPKDSDGDTYSNIDEIKALTFPGNTSDYPAPAVTVTFKITDGLNNIQNAAVSMDSIKMKTDSSGTAVFTNIAPGDHPYAVSKTGYKRLSGVVSATGNVTVFVKLVLK